MQGTTASIAYFADASSIHTRRWVADFVRRGYEAHVFSFLPGEIPRAHVHVQTAPWVRQEGGNWQYLWHLPSLRRSIRQLQPALLHAHYITSYGLLAALTGYHPLVLTAWGTDVLVTPKQSPLYRALLRWTLTQADLVTSDAESMSQEILCNGVPEKKLLTIPLGVDLELFNEIGRQWPSVGERLVSTRQLLPNTNLDTVLRALRLVRQEIPSLRFRVIGDGPERKRLESLSTQLRLADCITWHGSIEHQQMPQHLRAADLYVALTLSDSTSVSLLEAMACGAFPIVSDLPANQEWIQAGKNGYLIAPGDSEALARAISQAAHDPRLRQRAAKANREAIVQRANWQANMTMVEQAYCSLIRYGTEQ
jgi:glycosyltransferase involved in cell wall biosynthesis